MPRITPPEVIEKIRKKEEEKHRDNRIPLYLPDDRVPAKDDQDSEETSSIIIIDLID